jgi:hypothetical protein
VPAQATDKALVSLIATVEDAHLQAQVMEIITVVLVTVDILELVAKMAML